MKRVFIIHGYTGYPHKNWFPWLKSELEQEGARATVPAMPNTDAPQLSEWLPHLTRVIGQPNSETFLVGHSLGCITILQYLSALPEGSRIGGAVLVAGFAEPILFHELDNFFTPPLEAEKIKSACPKLEVINSDNDEYVPLWQGQRIADRFNATLTVLNGAGHINQSSGFTQLPVVLEKLRTMFNHA
jgi:uncharacterized protein